jgi:hypothetical protein
LELDVAPKTAILKGANPNPFNPTTEISFELSDVNNVSLIIYDIQGREVATLDTRYLTLGNNSMEWNAHGLPSGVYFARLQAGNNIQLQKLLLVK